MKTSPRSPQGGPAAASAVPDETHLMDYVRVLYKRRWIAIPVFLVTFLRLQAKSSWTTALLLGVGAAIALYFVFERGLKVQVHRGFVVTYLLDRLDQ